MGKRKLSTPKNPDVMSLETPSNDQTLDKDYKGMGVVYVGHIPNHFQEKEMRQFFGQFGDILKLRISRSKKTANSKGYSFILYENEEVAKIVANTMNDYILCGRLLKCQYIPMSRVHKDTFKGASRPFKKIDWQGRAKVERNRVKTTEEHQKSVKRLLKKETERRRKIAALGIDYDFAGYVSITYICNLKVNIVTRFDLYQ
ncbi:MKI67 FHA domain-interacting nucleolar phosphoprotein-like [Bolinopsis microptera]|uniref:MKI67 FHA domain-interacting nucleolar phosphoprotein-like n=1 Tax=Bolinopsis microptera TaxID=2820187 RepID=UPI003078E2C0